MQAEQIEELLDRIEDCADEAKSAVGQGAAPADLRRAVLSLHERASQAKHAPARDEAGLRETVNGLEALADQALQLCRQAGGGVDARVQDAVKKAHAELSRAKHALMAHA